MRAVGLRGSGLNCGRVRQKHAGNRETYGKTTRRSREAMNSNSCVNWRGRCNSRERWAKAPSPLKGPFVGLLFTDFGLILCVLLGLLGGVGGCLGLLWGLFGGSCIAEIPSASSGVGGLAWISPGEGGGGNRASRGALGGRKL